MVKNTGGNKAKKFARKVVSAPDRGTRLAEEQGEMYAIVLKLMGNNICEVLCIDGETRQCVIRKKFSGKGKRDNFLCKGRWVLVGLRSWEVTRKEKEKCDLLEVYSDYNRETLIKKSSEDFRPFLSIMCEQGENNSEFMEFVNAKEIEFTEDLDDEKKIPDSLDGHKSDIYLQGISDSDDEENNQSWCNYDEDESTELGEIRKDEKNDFIKSITDNMSIVNIDDI